MIINRIRLKKIKLSLKLLLLICTTKSLAIDVSPYLKECSPNVAANTMLAIIKTESNSFPWSIGLNIKGKRLFSQPANFNQAVKWVNYLEQNKYNFDVGLAQVNIKNIHKFGYKAQDLLDPCTNLKVSSSILHKNYNQARLNSSNSYEALLKALSAYNTGNYSSGFTNGYVNKVINNSKLISVDLSPST